MEQEVADGIARINSCSCGANHEVLRHILRHVTGGATRRLLIQRIVRSCLLQLENDRPLMEEKRNCMMQLTIAAETLQETLHLLLPLLDNAEDAAAIYDTAANVANRFWNKRMSEEIPAGRVLESPLLEVVSTSFRQCRISYELPQLAQLAQSTLWMVPFALPRLLAREFPLDASLPAVRRVLTQYLRVCLRNPAGMGCERTTLSMAMMTSWALELHLGGFEALQRRMSECVSARREDPLLVSLFVVFLSNVRGMRAGRELAELVGKEWRGKKLYLKKERLEWVVCLDDEIVVSERVS